MNASAGGVVATNVAIGSVISGLTDFTNLATIFARWTIVRAKLICLPNAGYAVALPSYRGPLAIGYFNDQSAPSNPTSYTLVL